MAGEAGRLDSLTMSTPEVHTPGRRLSRRRATALLLGGSLALGLAACAIPDGPVTEGARPNRPTAVTTPSVNPETDPAKLTIPLSQVPAFRAATPDADGWTTNSMTDASGDFKWRVLGADNQPIKDYQPSQTVAFGDPQTYTQVPGVLVFRGNNARIDL